MPRDLGRFPAAWRAVARGTKPMGRRCGLPGLLVACLLAGCATSPRLAAPPDPAPGLAPAGFTPEIRLRTTDLAGLSERRPGFVQGIRRSATDGSIDVLALSGGGSGGAFGAGALVGLGESGRRPRFELVTGVSAGALIAPFAFLGPAWDDRLRDAFSGERALPLPRHVGLSVVGHLLFPRGIGGRSALTALVDRYVTTDLVDAVAREGADGRRLVVATTDLDRQETVLWDMVAIARHGGEAARKLFRDVLVASASVPGVFPPVVIRVASGSRRYDELHVDGSVTTPVFATPLVAEILAPDDRALAGANLYLIVNGRLAVRPETVPVGTLPILSRSFDADMMYKTREAIALTIGFARRQGARFLVTEIPVDHPIASFVDFRPQAMRPLFEYARRCAREGRLWLSAQQSIERNLRQARGPAAGDECPASQR